MNFWEPPPVGYWKVPNARVFLGTYEKPGFIRRFVMWMMGWKWVTEA